MWDGVCRVSTVRACVFLADDESEARLERALKEIEQLKVDREVAVDKRDKQVCKVHMNQSVLTSIPL